MPGPFGGVGVGVCPGWWLVKSKGWYMYPPDIEQGRGGYHTYGRLAGGTHPTGMLFCLVHKSVVLKSLFHFHGLLHRKARTSILYNRYF